MHFNGSIEEIIVKKTVQEINRKELSRREVLRGASLMGIYSLTGMPVSAAPDTALVAAAKKEGALTVYGDPTLLAPLVAGFARQYPDIKVSSATGGGRQMYNRYLTERSAGRIQGDVLFVGEDALSSAQMAGDTVKYVPEGAAVLPAYAVRRDRDYILINGIVSALMWNRDGMSGKPVPDDWSSFMNPPAAWNNLVAIADIRASSAVFTMAAAIHQVMGEEKASAIFGGLRKINVEITPNMGVQVNKMQTGERPLSFYCHTGYYGQMLQRGAPIEMRIPKSGAVGAYGAVGLMKGAPHPSAGKLFMEYTTTPEAAQALVKMSAYALHKGAPTPDKFPAIADMKIMDFDMEKAVQKAESITKWWLSVMNLK